MILSALKNMTYIFLWVCVAVGSYVMASILFNPKAFETKHFTIILDGKDKPGVKFTRNDDFEVCAFIKLSELAK